MLGVVAKMVTYTPSTMKIAQLIRADENKELVLQPKFQRRLAWTDKARMYLIDTILRGMPIPKVYLRRAIYPDRPKPVLEVVDGQQRLAAILDFRKGKLSLNRTYSPEHGGSTFDRLNDDTQRRFLNYIVSIETLDGASDRDVWQAFERLNIYTLTLNRQEKLNAEFFGLFKQTCYHLAGEVTDSETWNMLDVISDRQIARMREVELTSDILTALAVGIQDITYIKKIYSNLDESYPRRVQHQKRFRDTISFVKNELSEGVRRSRFKNLSWFYSLMVATADCLFGIPGGTGPRQVQLSSRVIRRMIQLDEAIRPEEVPPPLATLKSALARGTSHVSERRTRHRYFTSMLVAPTQRWKELWREWNEL